MLLAEQPKCPPPVGHIAMDRGEYSSAPGVSFGLHHFSATLIPQGHAAPLCYQKLTVVSHADISVSNDSLTRLFDQKLSDSESKISDFKAVIAPDRTTLSGKVKKVIPIEFSISGPVSTDGRAIVLHADKIKADGIPVKALLELVGEHLSSVLAIKNSPGITVQDNSLSFLPEEVAHLKGHIRSVECTDSGLVLHYGAVHHAAASSPHRHAAPPAHPRDPDGMMTPGN